VHFKVKTQTRGPLQYWSLENWKQLRDEVGNVQPKDVKTWGVQKRLGEGREDNRVRQLEEN